MSPNALALLLGAVVWFITAVLVEGEIFRPFREAIEKWAGKPDRIETVRHPIPGGIYMESLVRLKAEHPFRLKLAYLTHCHMCCGVWVGLLVAAATPYRLVESTLPLGAWFLTGIAYKAVAHLILAVNHLLTRAHQKESPDA